MFEAIVQVLTKIESKLDQVIDQHECLEHRLKRIEALLAQTADREVKIMDVLADLTNQVKSNTDAEDSAATLLGNLSTLLKNALASGDPNAIPTIITNLEQHRAALAAAIVANTPAAPAPAPTA